MAPRVPGFGEAMTQHDQRPRTRLRHMHADTVRLDEAMADLGHGRSLLGKGPSVGTALVVHPLSALGGGEGRGEVGDSRALAGTHLTLPRLRRGPLPLPLKGGEGFVMAAPLPRYSVRVRACGHVGCYLFGSICGEMRSAKEAPMDGTTELLESDRRFLVHPLHHPEEHKAPLLVEEGRGAMLHLADGRQVIDGLAG